MDFTNLFNHAIEKPSGLLNRCIYSFTASGYGSPPANKNFCFVGFYFIESFIRPVKMECVACIKCCGSFYQIACKQDFMFR